MTYSHKDVQSYLYLTGTYIIGVQLSSYNHKYATLWLLSDAAYKRHETDNTDIQMKYVYLELKVSKLWSIFKKQLSLCGYNKKSLKGVGSTDTWITSGGAAYTFLYLMQPLGEHSVSGEKLALHVKETIRMPKKLRSFLNYALTTSSVDAVSSVLRKLKVSNRVLTKGTSIVYEPVYFTDQAGNLVYLKYSIIRDKADSVKTLPVVSISKQEATCSINKLIQNEIQKYNSTTTSTQY